MGSRRPGSGTTSSRSSTSSKPSARFALKVGAREIDVPEGGCTIGRASDCHIQVEDGLASRHHARCHETPDGLVAADLESRNGVLVNQRKIKAPTLVAHGDVIGVGLTTIEVVDRHFLHRPAHLTTLPPPAKIPLGLGDMDGAPPPTKRATLVALSAREREVLSLLVLGHTQREMADQLHVSVKTIESHRAKIAEKLGCSTRAELVAYALAAGLLKGSLAPGKIPDPKSG